MIAPGGFNSDSHTERVCWGRRGWSLPQLILLPASAPVGQERPDASSQAAADPAGADGAQSNLNHQSHSRLAAAAATLVLAAGSY
jgi:hypothetical protein